MFNFRGESGVCPGFNLIAFVLNYVPTLGSIIAVIPPTLVALIFNGVGRGIAILVGLAVIQVVMGNFVDPPASTGQKLTTITFWTLDNSHIFA